MEPKLLKTKLTFFQIYLGLAPSLRECKLNFFFFFLLITSVYNTGEVSVKVQCTVSDLFLQGSPANWSNRTTGTRNRSSGEVSPGHKLGYISIYKLIFKKWQGTVYFRSLVEDNDPFGLNLNQTDCTEYKPSNFSFQIYKEEVKENVRYHKTFSIIHCSHYLKAQITSLFQWSMYFSVGSSLKIQYSQKLKEQFAPVNFMSCALKKSFNIPIAIVEMTVYGVNLKYPAGVLR